MNRASPQIRSLAKQLQALEKAQNLSGDVDESASFLTIDKLRLNLSLLMGRTGFQALVARALRLSTPEVPWLSTVRVVGDGELEGLTAARTSVNAAVFSSGEVVLMAQLIGLLVAFIGQTLTLRLIKQLWPQLPFKDADFSSTADNEDAQ